MHVCNIDMQHSTSHSPLPLPRVPGPKLGPSAGDVHAEIRFIEALGNSDDLDSQVWKVEINGAAYDLKMVSCPCYRGDGPS